MNTDLIDRIIRESSDVWPGYCAESEEVVLRIFRAFHFIEQEMVFGLSRFDLIPGEFGVLIELRLSGPPYRLTPTQLYNRLLVTSGGMTGRIDKLEKREYVRRIPDPNDRRSLLVELMERGKEVINEAACSQHRMEEHITQSLSPDEKGQLAKLLRKLLVDLEAHDCCSRPVGGERQRPE
ncbi:MAG: MarR family transcriptional regulator [Chloroflexi bacterium]|nr:MarR family transcriptional regulator [Chloroflexota bacterium]